MFLTHLHIDHIGAGPPTRAARCLSRTRVPRTPGRAPRRRAHQPVRPRCTSAAASSRSSIGSSRSSSRSTSTRNRSSTGDAISRPTPLPHDAAVRRDEVADPTPRVVRRNNRQDVPSTSSAIRSARIVVGLVSSNAYTHSGRSSSAGAGRRPRSAPPPHRSSACARPCAPGSAPARRTRSLRERARYRRRAARTARRAARRSGGCRPAVRVRARTRAPPGVRGTARSGRVLRRARRWSSRCRRCAGARKNTRSTASRSTPSSSSAAAAVLALRSPQREAPGGPTPASTRIVVPGGADDVDLSRGDATAIPRRARGRAHGRAPSPPRRRPGTLLELGERPYRVEERNDLDLADYHLTLGGGGSPCASCQETTGFRSTPMRSISASITSPGRS